MFDIVTLMTLAQIDVQAKAASEGRVATSEEYQTAMEKAWDVSLNASVNRDMAAAGFVKTDDGWKKPRLGFFGWLLNG